MKRLLLLIALTACAWGCTDEPDATAPARTAAPDKVLATQAPASKPPSIVPMPSDQSEIDRMILAGYTPHGTHLHPPGVKECPLTQGSEAVM